METSNKRYREKLVQQIKDAGEELIKRSDTLVHPDLELITDFDITLSFSQDCFPEITFSTSVVNKTACDRLCKRRYNAAMFWKKKKLNENNRLKNKFRSISLTI